jgi:RimJ/RimL family protein N-acetyltransferase
MEVLKRQKSEIENDQRYTLGIFHKEVGTLLGYIFIQDIHRCEKTSAILDFRLINIYWGNSFAKEAVAEALKLKTALKIDKMQINPKSLSKLKL